jgi:hypothetical protein
LGASVSAAAGRGPVSARGVTSGIDGFELADIGELWRCQSRDVAEVFQVLVSPRSSEDRPNASSHHLKEKRKCQEIWLITGSSRGFGREIVKAALEAVEAGEQLDDGGLPTSVLSENLAAPNLEVDVTECRLRTSGRLSSS